MKRYRLWLILLVLLVLGGSVALWWQTKPVPVDIVGVTRGPAVEVVYGTGFVEPRHPSSVSARVTAPVVAVLVREGDRVKRGQALITLDDAQQRALLAQSAAQRREAGLEASRTLALYAKGWVTKAARDQAASALDANRAAEAASAAVMQQMVVRAGADGIVLKREVEPGDLATSAKELLQIGDPSDLWITTTIDERDIPALAVGQAALLKSDAWPGRVIHGHVVELTPGGDPLQRAFRARIVLDPGQQPTPIGLSLEVNVITRSVANALLVPAAAVSGDKVWVVQGGKAQARTVKLGITGGDKVQVVSGLAGGEQLVLNPPADLSDGARVAPRTKR